MIRFTARRTNLFGIGMFVSSGENMFGAKLLEFVVNILWWELSVCIESAKRY